MKNQIWTQIISIVSADGGVKKSTEKFANNPCITLKVRNI